MKLTAVYDLPMGRYFLQLNNQDYLTLKKRLKITTDRKVLFTPDHQILIIEDVDNKLLIHKFIPSNGVITTILDLIHNLMFRVPCKEINLNKFNFTLTTSDKELIASYFKNNVINGHVYTINNTIYTPNNVLYNTISFKEKRYRPYVSINDCTPILYHENAILPCIKQKPIVSKESFTFYCYTNKIGKVVYSTKLCPHFIKNWEKSGFNTLTRISIDNSPYNLEPPLSHVKIITSIGGRPIVSSDIEEKELKALVENVSKDNTVEYKLLQEIYTILFDTPLEKYKEKVLDYIRSINAILYNNKHHILHTLCVKCNLIEETEYTQEYDVVSLQNILSDYARINTIYGCDFPIYEYLPSLKLKYIIGNLAKNVGSSTLNNVYKCTSRCVIRPHLPFYCRCSFDKTLNHIIKNVLKNNNINIDVRLANSIEIFQN